MAGHDAWSPGEADDGSDAEDGERLRGWIHPDDRLWRHPSEVGRDPGPGERPPGSGDPARSPVGLQDTGHLGRRGIAPWLICGSLCVALVVGATAVVVGDTGERAPDALVTAVPLANSAPTTDPAPVNTTGWALGTVVHRIKPSTVALRVTRGHDITTLVGVVAEAGGIVVTSAHGVDGADHITVIEPDGTHQPATTVGVDPRTDLAVVRVPDDLPAATFASADPTEGSVAMAVAVRPRPRSSLEPLVYAGTVVSSGQSVLGDPATATFATTAVRAPLGRAEIGSPLVDPGGNVLGVLDDTVGDVAVFLPGTLVDGVARQLVSSGHVDHGRLGATGAAPTATRTSSAGGAGHTGAAQGALLADVVKASPAAQAGLRSGDVVLAVDGAPVHSTSELTTRLYPDPPGTSVEVTFRRAQQVETVGVVLADPDTVGDSGGVDTP